MLKFSDPAVVAYLQSLNAVKRSTEAARRGFDLRFPHWTSPKDVRRTALFRIEGALTSLNLSLMFYGGDLLRKEWWQVNTDPPFDDAANQSCIETYVQFVRRSYLTEVSNIVESSARVLLRHLTPKTNESTAVANVMYRELLAKTIGAEPGQLALLSLVTSTRNTLHNNGLHFSSADPQKDVVYGGRTYRFAHATAVDFVTWDFLRDRTEELVALLTRIIEHPAISADAMIVDPAFDT